MYQAFATLDFNMAWSFRVFAIEESDRLVESFVPAGHISVIAKNDFSTFWSGALAEAPPARRRPARQRPDHDQALPVDPDGHIHDPSDGEAAGDDDVDEASDGAIADDIALADDWVDEQVDLLIDLQHRETRQRRLDARRARRQQASAAGNDSMGADMAEVSGGASHAGSSSGSGGSSDSDTTPSSSDAGTPARAPQPVDAELAGGRGGEVDTTLAVAEGPAQDGAPRTVRRPLEGPRSALPTLELEHGAIKFKRQDGSFCAHCPVHGDTCRRTRVGTPGRRPQQGRPLGSLAAWLQLSGTCSTKAEHQALGVEALALPVRAAARHMLYTIPDADYFFGLERERREGEGSEPEDLP